ncbi:hypothetical protein D3C81_1518780 [compost metagenome]
MRLRVEEGFGVHHVLLAALQEIRPGQVVEVLFGAQDVGAHVVQVQEFLKIAVVVGAAQGIDVGPGQRHAVALRQPEQQLGFERALQVQMQFRLGQCVEPVVHGCSNLEVMRIQWLPVAGRRSYPEYPGRPGGCLGQGRCADYSPPPGAWQRGCGYKFQRARATRRAARQRETNRP